MHKLSWLGFPLSAALLLLLFSLAGEPRMPQDWKLLDIAGEGGTALMAAGWVCIVLGSRPAGRTTQLLALGLAAIALGAWADCLDEFFRIVVPLRFDKGLEAVLTPLGMGLLTCGIAAWRAEQLQLSEHMQRRERLFREHRAFDRITQLADAGYLRRQLALEQGRGGAPAALLLLEVESLAGLRREHGHREADRALQAVTHQLLLNLRNQDLLCRYAGDRLALLLPATTQRDAAGVAAHLRAMVAATHFHTQSGSRLALALRSACAALEGDVPALLARLNREIDGLALGPVGAGMAEPALGVRGA